MNKTGAILLILLMTVSGAFAGFFLKKSAGRKPFWRVLLSGYLYLGGFLYLLCAVFNIYVLRFLPYSVVLPLTSVTYIWTLAISAAALKEKLSVRKLAGVCAIVAGAVLISLFN